MPAAARRTALAFLGLVCSCEPWPPPPPVSAAQFAAELQAFREDRRARLLTPGSGALTWIGIWDLPVGETAVGADSSLPVILPATSSPRLLGTFSRGESDILFTPAPRSSVRLGDGRPVTSPVAVTTDRTRGATVLAAGSIRFRVHGEPGTDRLWVRVWDEDPRARETLQLPALFPPDTAWRVAARFVRFETPRDILVADVDSGMQSYHAPGELVFRLDGRQHRLIVSADSASRDYFIMLWDSTATNTTYQAGRYLRVPLADSTGWTVIDFNRTYNPPCALTAYSTCAFAPPENRLTAWITAGERRP